MITKSTAYNKCPIKVKHNKEQKTENKVYHKKGILIGTYLITY